MFKKLRRLSSRSRPVKQQVTITVRSLCFDAAKLASSPIADALPTTEDLLRIVFSRNKNASYTKWKAAEQEVHFGEDCLSLVVTFYKGMTGVVMEKKGELSLQIRRLGSQNSLEDISVLGSVALDLSKIYADESARGQDLCIDLERDGVSLGITLDVAIDITDTDATSLMGEEDASQSEFDINELQSSEHSVPNPSGIAFGSNKAPTASAGGIDELHWHQNPLKSEYDFQLSEEIGLLSSQLAHSKAELAQQQEITSQQKQQIDQLTTLVDFLQQSHVTPKKSQPLGLI